MTGQNTDVLRHVLGIAYYYSPAPLVGARRTAKFAKYMPEFGYALTVITTRAFGSLPDDAHRLVYRSRDPAGSMKKTVLGAASDVGALRGNGSRFTVKRLVISVSRTLAIPDPEVIWLPFGLFAALGALRRNRYVALYSSSSPETDHLVAALLKLLTGLPWVADFRDGWMFEPTRNIRVESKWRRWVEGALEASVLRLSDAIVTVNEVIADDFRARYPSSTSRVFSIPNGYDAQDLRATAPKPVDGKFRIVHTGRLSASESARSISGLLEALRVLKESNPGMLDVLNVTFVGNMSQAELLEIERSSAARNVSVIPQVSHAAAIEYQAGASVLLLVTSKDSRGESTTKLYEYLASGRPVLALTGHSTAAELVRALDAGLVVDPEDTPGIVKALERFFEEWKQGTLRGASAEKVERFDRRNLTRDLCELFNHVVEHHTDEHRRTVSRFR